MPRRHLTLTLAAEQRRQPHCQQRMPAEGEEIRLRIIHLTAQQLRECLRHANFTGRLRRTSSRFRRGLRYRQRFTIQFAVGAQRQIRHLHQHHRHHMRRQPRGELLTQRFAVQRQARFGDQVSHQLTCIAATDCCLIEHTGVGHRLRHVRQTLHHAIDFAQFNTLTANFQLIVTAPEVFHCTVIQPARDIAGAVHPLPGTKGSAIKRLAVRSARPR